MKKRVLAFLLAGTMLLSSLAVQAEEPADQAVSGEEAGGNDGAAPAGETEQGGDAASPEQAPDQASQPEVKEPGTTAQPSDQTPEAGGTVQPSDQTPETGSTAQPSDQAPASQDAQGTGEGEVTEPITKEDKPYLSLGANLSEEQRSTVLELLGVNPLELSEYDVIYTTIDEEYKYLGEYLPKETIGSRSLSSVLVVKREPGNGINITTKNISYCTIGMYKNALITAGLTDADIIVAAPFPISGTAALVGAMKAYAVMTGEEVSEESMDAALNELVLTGDLAESVGDSQQVEEFIAYLKQQIVENHLETEEEIRAAIDEACEKLDIVLSESEIQQIISLLQKISSLDLDLDSIMNQARDLYDRISQFTADTGFWGKVKSFFSGIIDFIMGLFR